MGAMSRELQLSEEWLSHAIRTRLFDRWKEWERDYFEGSVVSHARVVGNRRDEAIIADRERRARSMGNGQAAPHVLRHARLR